MTTTEATTTEEPPPTRRWWELPPVAVRVRILGFMVLLLGLAIGAGLLLGRSILLAQLDGDVSDALDQEVEELRRLATGSDPDTGEPFGDDVEAIFDTFLDRNIPVAGETYVTIIDGRPHRSTASPVPLLEDPELLARWGSLTGSEAGRIDTDAGPARYQAVPLAAEGTVPGVFVVVFFLEEGRDEVESFFRVSAVVSALMLLVTGALAWLVAGRVLRPVRDLTGVAKTISETDLGQRIEVRGNDEIAELARTFNTMLDRLQGAFDTQRAFVDDAGHELRTPITIVRGHLELMEDDAEDRRQTLEIVTDELDRMNRIVDDLVLLAKAERPDFLRPEDLDLEELLAGIDARAQPLGSDRRWTVAARAGRLRGDRDRLTQAMLNLAANAVAHTQAGDTIEIGGRAVGDRIHLWVADTGEGVSEEDRAAIFDRFRRGRNARRRSDGAGLGLAIVTAIASAHGGTVGLESEVGGGATFTLDLPAYPADPTTPGRDDGPHPDR